MQISVNNSFSSAVFSQIIVYMFDRLSAYALVLFVNYHRSINDFSGTDHVNSIISDSNESAFSMKCLPHIAVFWQNDIICILVHIFMYSRSNMKTHPLIFSPRDSSHCFTLLVTSVKIFAFFAVSYSHLSHNLCFCFGLPCLLGVWAMKKP